MLPLFSWYVFGCPKQGGKTAIGQKPLPKRSFCSCSPLLSRLVLSATNLDERSRNKETVKCQNSQNMDHRVGRRHICAEELVLVPRFGLSRVRNSTTSRVRNSTTSWGDHFRTTKIGVFEDFCDKFWCQLVFFCFVFLVQLVTSYFLFSIFPKISFSGEEAKKLGFFGTG